MSRYNGTMPKWFAGYVAFEDEATELKIYDIQLVNGLFQTPDYASAMIRAHFPERHLIVIEPDFVRFIRRS